MTHLDAKPWQGKKVLVTGAGGFIGSHLVESLLAQGALVRAFIRYTSRNEAGFLQNVSGIPELEILAGDLTDESAVDGAVEGMEIVFHLGALISIPYSYQHPRQVVTSNVIGTLNVLMACRRHGTQRLVHTSTSEVYGTARHVPIDEEHPLQGQSPYSASKIGADKLVESFHCAYDLPAVTVRPFNTYGPRQSARAVIPTIISQALNRETIHLGNLDSKRDFTYVSDTVAGFELAALAEGVEGEVFNLGTGTEVSIGELAEMILQIVDRQVPIELDEQRLRPEKSEVDRLLSDNSYARRRLDWQPQVSLEDGLRKTVDWIAEHPEFIDPDRYVY